MRLRERHGQGPHEGITGTGGIDHADPLGRNGDRSVRVRDECPVSASGDHQRFASTAERILYTTRSVDILAGHLAGRIERFALVDDQRISERQHLVRWSPHRREIEDQPCVDILDPISDSAGDGPCQLALQDDDIGALH